MTDTQHFIPGQVTVVIPVYNEERFLRETLASVVNQADCVIIGDNASTDGTETICREFGEKYPHVRYFKNEQNIGSIKNIISCYEKVTTEFVMHVGGHDLIPLGYVEELKRLLTSNAGSICAFADVINFDFRGNEKRRIFPKIKRFRKDAQNPNPYFRSYRYFYGNFSWGPIYGLFRSETFLPVAKNFRIISNCDAAILFEALLHGTFLYSPNTAYRRRDNHIEKTQNDYYDDAMKRMYGVSGIPSHELKDLHPLAEQVLFAYENYESSQYLASKNKYHRLLKLRFCILTGEKTGYRFFDFRLRMKRKWKAFCRYLKMHWLPAWAVKSKWKSRLMESEQPCTK